MEFVPRPADPDEVRQGKQLIHILPRQDLSQSVRAGDEEQLRVRTVASSQIAQRIDGVVGPGSVDIDAGDGEARIRGWRDDGHQIPMLWTRDLFDVLLVRASGGDQNHLVEVEGRLDLAGRDEVAVV